MRPTAFAFALALAITLSSACAEEPRNTSQASLIASAEFSHQEWDALLQEFVQDGNVDYTGLLTARPRLNAYLDSAANLDLTGWSTDARKAFWINMYNAHMVAIILDQWPVESVQDIGRVIVPTMQAFRIGFEVAGSERSLNDIEHKILRAKFNDPRIHAAINCASLSCPKLVSGAYVPETVERQLAEAMDAFLRDPARNRVFESPPQLSKIFDWFKEDFERSGGTVWGYVRSQFTPDELARLAATAKPRYLDYDWSLNGQ